MKTLTADRPPAAPVRIGISSCLLGHQVRFDGGHKRNRFLTDQVAAHVSYVPFCPEVDAGMGTPRETIRLVAKGSEIRVEAPKSETDWTDALSRSAEAKVAELEKGDLSGYVLKSGSPSCGMERVRLYQEIPTRNGRGIFAQVLLERMPLLPVEEEGRLNDARLRENFFQRVFAYRRLQDLFRSDWQPKDLVEFHSREKLNLLAHEPEAARALGRLVARAKTLRREEVISEYSRSFMEALAKPSSDRAHGNVLHRVLGFFRDVIPRQERAQIRVLVEDFRQGLVPLVVPLSMVAHYIRLHRLEYLEQQTYFDPHPRELSLRNSI